MTELENKCIKSPGVTQEAELTHKEQRQPLCLNIPGFIKEEVGLGDVIKRVTSAVGIKPCHGCQRRATALNQWLVFSPHRRK
jgi:hypothetical protein